MKYDIFISYKRLGISSATAAYLYDLLTKKGYSVFFDRKEIRQGRFNEQLLTHIEGAQDIFVLLEQNSLNSCFNGISGSYKTDWFCMEITHALKNKKRIIPLLLDGYKMPAIQELPPELKSLALENAIIFEASEIDDFYKKYLIDQGYLQSKPKNLFMSSLNGNGIADFLFYSNGHCDIFEYGNLIGSLDQNVDEKHPYIYTVKRAGEHRFDCKNNDTCEEQSFIVSIEKDTQKYVPIQWKLTQNLWELSEKDIEAQDDSNTLLFWGRGLFEGSSTHEPKIEMSFLSLQKAAKQWNIDAKNYIVRNVNAITNNKIERAVIVPWLKLAADYGSNEALYILGCMYLRGNGVERNGKTALYYFEQSANLGNDKAMWQIGWMYTEGIGVKRNYSKGRLWYEKSINLGNKTSMIWLGEIYQYGRGTKQDLDKALSLYTQALEKEKVSPLIRIGSLYFGPGKYHNMSKAYSFFCEGANIEENNNEVAFSKVMCSIMMKKGYGTDVNIEGAERHMNEVDKISATFKDICTFYNSISWQLYLMEIYDEALPLALKSIELGENPANLDTLGAIYKALGDYEKALEAYNKCLSLGKQSAKLDIEKINNIIKKNKK